LLEMTRASGADATLVLNAIPLLDGALECVAQGALSSLHSANARVQTALRNHKEFNNHPRYPLLFDPQTAGGLLASVPAHQAEACLLALRQAGYPHASCIGQVLPPSEAIAPLVLADAVPTAARQ
jgi:selenide,water dikinase